MYNSKKLSSKSSGKWSKSDGNHSKIAFRTLRDKYSAKSILSSNFTKNDNIIASTTKLWDKQNYVKEKNSAIPESWRDTSPDKAKLCWSFIMEISNDPSKQLLIGCLNVICNPNIQMTRHMLQALDNCSENIVQMICKIRTENAIILWIKNKSTLLHQIRLSTLSNLNHLYKLNTTVLKHIPHEEENSSSKRQNKKKITVKSSLNSSKIDNNMIDGDIRLKFKRKRRSRKKSIKNNICTT